MGSCEDGIFTPTAIDAQRADLARTWGPTGGNYDTQQMLAMINATHKLLQDTSNAITKTIADGVPSDIRNQLLNFQALLQRRFQESMEFVNAVNTARANNVRVINAPGFKHWVLLSMAYASSSMAAMRYFACIRPWFLGTLKTLVNVFDFVYRVGKGMVKIAVAAGEAVLALPDTASKVVRYTMLAGVAYAAYHLFKRSKPAAAGGAR